jgi:hypothetical protein
MGLMPENDPASSVLKLIKKAFLCFCEDVDRARAGNTRPRVLKA